MPKRPREYVDNPFPDYTAAQKTAVISAMNGFNFRLTEQYKGLLIFTNGVAIIRLRLLKCAEGPGQTNINMRLDISGESIHAGEGLLWDDNQSCDEIPAKLGLLFGMLTSYYINREILSRMTQEQRSAIEKLVKAANPVNPLN